MNIIVTQEDYDEADIDALRDSILQPGKPPVPQKP